MGSKFERNHHHLHDDDGVAQNKKRFRQILFLGLFGFLLLSLSIRLALQAFPSPDLDKFYQGLWIYESVPQFSLHGKSDAKCDLKGTALTLLYDVNKDHLVKFKAIFEGAENKYIWKCGPFGIASSASLANVAAQVIYKHGPINGLVLPVTQSPDADFELFLVTVDPGREPFSVEFTGIFHDKLPQRAFDTYSFGVDLSQEQYNKQKLDLVQVALDGVFEASVVSTDQYTIDAASTSGSIIEFKNARGNFTVNLKDLSATNRQGFLLLLAAGIFGTSLSLLSEFLKDILR